MAAHHGRGAVQDEGRSDMERQDPGIVCLGEADVTAWCKALEQRELASATVEKYAREARRFVRWLKRRGDFLEKRLVIEYKARLCETFAPATVNVALAAVNGLLAHTGHAEIQVRRVRLPARAYREPERDLTRCDYERMLAAADKADDVQALLVLETL